MEFESGPMREWARRKANVPARVEIVLDDGQRFTTGKAVVRDISFTGALLTDLELKREMLPAQKFKIRLEFLAPEQQGFGALCTPVRLDMKTDFAIGVEFDEFWAGEKES